METRTFGKLGPVSALTLGGGGTGGVWGATTREEAVETVRAAIDGGIDFIDVAPGYGDGEAERVVGEAFNGRLPEGVRISTKHHLGNVPPGEVAGALRGALAASLDRLRLPRVDLFFLHGMIVPDGFEGRGTPRSLFAEAVRPAFEAMVADGTIGAWGVSGVGVPSALLETLAEDPAPAAIQCVANLLDSPGGMRAYDEEPRPRDLIAAASARGVGVMGIRAVQAGALTDAIDRDLPGDHPEAADFRRAAPFRALARELGESPASLAHRYALSMEGVATVILGVKNRAELAECLQAEAQGPLAPALRSRIDAAVA